MSDSSRTEPTDLQLITPDEARQLLAAVPQRPRRKLETRDHLVTAGIVLLSFTAGLLALSGHAWWATAPALGAALASHHWVSRRLNQANEPRLRASAVTTIFTVWLLLPIWRGIVHDETIPFPEALIFAGLAPAAWLMFYIVLLIRR